MTVMMKKIYLVRCFLKKNRQTWRIIFRNRKLKIVQQRFLEILFPKTRAFSNFLERKMDSKIREACAAAWYCSESLKLWKDANTNERAPVYKRVDELVGPLVNPHNCQPTNRRDRAVVSIYEILK